MMKTIVSVTPLPVESDSRTFKQAASFSRLGYESVVVEGRSSSLAGDLPFGLISVSGAPASDRLDAVGVGDAGSSGGPEGTSPVKRMVQKLPMPVLGPIRDIYNLGAWYSAWIRRQIETYRALPSASLYVIHESIQFPAVYLASLRQRVPFVYDAHDLYSSLVAEHRLQAGYSPTIAATRNLIERVCVHRAAARMTVAPGLAEMQRRRFNRPFTVVRNAHDSRIDQKSPISVRTRAGVEPDAFLLVTIGNAKPSMAIKELLDAIVLLPEDVHLACVGRGYEAFASAIEERRLDGRVHLVGAVPPVQVASFLRDADAAANVYVAASPNAFNALPNGFFQSVAAGLPVLVPSLPEIQAISNRFDLGIAIDPSDARSVAAAVTSLRGDAERSARYRNNAAEAAAELSWDHEERRLAALVEPLTGPAVLP